MEGQIDLAAMHSGSEDARNGNLILLHGCCHNPTGGNLPLDAWRSVADVASSKGLTPFVDLAYAGLGDGLKADVRSVRDLLLSSESALVAVSCSKNFGLYRDRTGMLLLLGKSSPITLNLSRNAASNARSLWPPPDHGAAVVRSVLASAELTQRWHAELNQMRRRGNAIRARLADLFLPHLDLGPLRHQRRMFAMLALSANQIRDLRERYGI